MTDTFVLKLVLTPLLIAAASLAGRRWGPAVGGWFVGLPLTSGPIALFLALDHGAGFAAAAAVGSLTGALAEAAFCLAYAAVARAGWPRALAAATVTFAIAAALLQRASLAPAAAAVRRSRRWCSRWRSCRAGRRARRPRRRPRGTCPRGW